MTDRVRWGVLGVAAIATKKVIPAMQQADNCEIVAIASRDAERAAHAAGQLGIARHYGSYQALLDDDEIDAVYIPLPNNLHAEWTIRAAEHKKHVLCEKPLAMTMEEGRRLMELALDTFENQLGMRPVGYRSPYWDYSEATLDLVEEFGFLYDSSLMGDDYTPYYARTGDVIELEKPALFGRATTLVEMPIHWAVDDAPHFDFVRTETVNRVGLMNASLVGENWINDFLYMRRTVDWGVLTYTCHPYVIGRGARMMMLENVIKTAKKNGAVFMTMEDAAAEFRKRTANK